MFAPAVVVHGLMQARLALSPRRPVCLLSARGAGRFAGAAWWRAMVDAATGETNPPVEISDILDCGDAPGAAMAALRHGQLNLVLDEQCPAFAAVTAAAGTLGARILCRRPRCLDLARPRAERALSAWLSDGAAGFG